jgi:Family of unknown function (DUF5995)
MHRRSALIIMACVLGLSAVAVAAPNARADLPTVDLTSDPWFVNWTEALPSGYLGVDTDSSDSCVAGRLTCVARVAQRLERQLSDLGCNHNAIFSLAYARTTEMLAQVEEQDPTFFDDTPWLNHYDATFADFYFAAWNSWQTSHSAPAAWQIAFSAADGEQVSAAGNLLLGMSAHVNRDLPFVLYEIGLVAPDGTSRKPDHDRVNQVLNMVIKPLIDEIATRYDPTVQVAPGGGSLVDLLAFQLLPTWREEAWRNAERLAEAPDSAARAVVAASIEQAAAAEAVTLRSESAYAPPLTSSAARDAYCAQHLN